MDSNIIKERLNQIYQFLVQINTFGEGSVIALGNSILKTKELFAIIEQMERVEIEQKELSQTEEGIIINNPKKGG
jgi:hypothetical protein